MPYFNKGTGWSAKFIAKFRSMLSSPLKHPSVPVHKNPHESKDEPKPPTGQWLVPPGHPNYGRGPGKE